MPISTVANPDNAMTSIIDPKVADTKIHTDQGRYTVSVQ